MPGQFDCMCLISLEGDLALNREPLNGHNFSTVGPITLFYDFLERPFR